MRKVLVPLMILLIVGAAFARGREEAPPAIALGDDETVYLSPETSSGVQDSVTIPISVTADASRNDVVVAYTIQIVNEDDQVVWTESGQDESEQPGFFGRLMQGLGLREKETTVSVPESREWDGTFLGSGLGADGAPVPDGEYSYTVTVTDSGEITGTSEPRTVVIDNTLPSATASAEYDVFSPDGDGRRDTVALTQSSSSEDEWVGAILLDGDEVLRVEWSGAVPGEYVWDGKDLAGRDLADGDYIYQLTSTDRAGNEFTFSMPAVTIDTAERPLDIVADTAAFSPNNDGMKDTVSFSFGRVDLNRLTSAVITVSDSDGNELESVEVGNLIGGNIVFDGYLNASRTLRIPEGTYNVSVQAEYEHGPIVNAGPATVTVDVTAPSGSVSSSDDIFSPEGDGYQDTLVVTHNVSEDDSWQGFVYIAGDVVVETFEFGTAVPEVVVWDGEDLNGNPVQDGTYFYQLIGRDAAGNESVTEPISVTIDRRPTTMDIEFSRLYFSPNGDGQGDTVTVRPNLSLPFGIESYTLTVKNPQGRVLGRAIGTGDLPREIVWDGRDLDGNYLPEGEYVGELALVYEKGNRPVGVSPVLTIENTIPRVSLRTSRNRLTPDGDGFEDTVIITPSVTPEDEIVRFTGRMVGLNGQTVREIESETLSPVLWDGTTATGRVSDTGNYVAILEVEHRNGTIREGRSNTIALGDADEIPPEVALMISPRLFSPDGDGVDDTVTFTLAVQDDNPVSQWEIRVYEEDGDLFHSFPVGDNMVRSIEWDGLNDAGELVEMAVDYDVRYEVADAAGNVAEGSETLTVDVLTEPLYGLRRILVNNILFEGYTTRYLYWDNDAEAQNVVSLEKIGDILRKFPDYKIELHGHAVSVLYYDPVLSDREQEQVLLGLSLARAEIIRDLFIGYGADEDRFTVVNWGKLRPLVPFDNLDERSINRRVEFYLIK